MPQPALSFRDYLSRAARQGRTPALIAVSVCLLPLTAMQFTAEVDWNGFDFVVAFSLLFGAGFAYNLLVYRCKVTDYKRASAITLGTAVLLVFVNGAVGLAGSADNAINLLFLGVLAVLATGVFVAACSPSGMARALVATGLAQAAVALVVLLTGGHQLPGASAASIASLTGVFIALWLGAGYFYRRAALA